MVLACIPTMSSAPTAPPAILGFTVDGAAELRPDVLAVVAAVLGVGRDHADAEDAASETMRRAMEGQSKFQEGLPVRPWLLGIARHVALDARRSRGRTMRRAVHDPENGESALDRVAATRPDPFEQLAEARRAAKVRAALATLPEGPRLALTLFHLEGLGYEEIVRRLGVPMGTVATWMSRGRKALQGELSDEGAVR
jgi:RNA polymerase sigma factor (sigma-70 family)